MPTALYPIHISHYLVCQSVLCHTSQKSELLKPWTVFWKTNDKKSLNVSITWGKSQKSDQSFFSLLRGYAMWVSVYNYNYKICHDSKSQYITCALRCQKGMKCFILLHETSQVSPEHPMCVLPSQAGQLLWQFNLSVRNLANSERIGQETFPTVQGLFSDWQFSQSQGAQKQKMRNESTASALDWVENKKKKGFPLGRKTAMYL